MLWQVLVQFVFRLAGGLALALWLTSDRDVDAGFFRVHLWVALGLNTLAAALLALRPDTFQQTSGLPAAAIAGAVLCYAGAVCWLYRAARAGRIVLLVVTVVDLWGGLLAADAWQTGAIARVAETLTASAVLGFCCAAMLLGHWYLNSPTMKLRPLNRLIIWTMLAVAARAALTFSGIVGSWSHVAQWGVSSWGLLGLRIAAGLIGVAGLCWMSRETLKIPNTQSATGILYVAVIFAFLGELTAQLISSEIPFPV